MRKKSVAPRKIDIQEFDCTKLPRMPDSDKHLAAPRERR